MKQEIKRKRRQQIMWNGNIAILNDFQIYGKNILNSWTLVKLMKNFLLEQQQLGERLAILTEFIQSNSSAREIKRAVAVKMALLG